MALFLSTPSKSVISPLKGEPGWETSAVIKLDDNDENSIGENGSSNKLPTTLHTPAAMTSPGVDSIKFSLDSCRDATEIQTPVATPISSATLEGDGNACCSADKRQQELEESERLAWQLMQEESMNAYELQVEYMRNNPELFSEEELTALNMVLQQDQNTTQVGNSAESEGGSFASDAEEGDEENSEDWTYERLLEIGQLAGDVKTERWRLRSTAVVQSIPSLTYEAFCANQRETGKSDVDRNCAVCMEEYHESDLVMVLSNCPHFFHSDCCEKWILDNNSCPMCKQKVTSSP